MKWKIVLHTRRLSFLVIFINGLNERIVKLGIEETRSAPRFSRAEVLKTAKMEVKIEVSFVIQGCWFAAVSTALFPSAATVAHKAARLLLLLLLRT